MFNFMGITKFTLIQIFYGDFFENYCEKIVSGFINMKLVISRSISAYTGPLQIHNSCSCTVLTLVFADRACTVSRNAMPTKHKRRNGLSLKLALPSYCVSDFTQKRIEIFVFKKLVYA